VGCHVACAVKLCVCVCTRMCVCVYVSVYTHTHTHTNVYICMYVGMYEIRAGPCWWTVIFFWRYEYIFWYNLVNAPNLRLLSQDIKVEVCRLASEIAEKCRSFHSIRWLHELKVCAIQVMLIFDTVLAKLFSYWCSCILTWISEHLHCRQMWEDFCPHFWHYVVVGRSASISEKVVDGRLASRLRSYHTVCT
jgi:hypothetical protein